MEVSRALSAKSGTGVWLTSIELNQVGINSFIFTVEEPILADWVSFNGMVSCTQRFSAGVVA